MNTKTLVRMDRNRIRRNSRQRGKSKNHDAKAKPRKPGSATGLGEQPSGTHTEDMGQKNVARG